MFDVVVFLRTVVDKHYCSGHSVNGTAHNFDNCSTMYHDIYLVDIVSKGTRGLEIPYNGSTFICT